MEIVMKDMYFRIIECFEEGMSAQNIASELNVPLESVLQVLEGDDE